MGERCANVVGLGLIGGSIAARLVESGWTVHGSDPLSGRPQTAVERGIISSVGLDPDAEITFVAVPVLQLRDEVATALASTRGVVTDVGSVKGPLVADIDDPRFIGGHPMAGSELDGLDGADATLFEGATWILTPTSRTPDSVFALAAGVAHQLGANVLALGADDHDRLIAVVSHVPHLTAATLMTLADRRSEEHASLLRMAAGGFRDMTRIASSKPGIWLDICRANREAIVATLDDFIAGLIDLRATVDKEDSQGLEQLLLRAREARSNLPARARSLEDAVEVRIPIPDRPGSAAEIFTLAAELNVNLANFEVVHSAEGDRGVAVVLVEKGQVELFRGGLIARGFKPGR
ncbi:MAG: prephenate dehydrogenase/arogenate dehydrogenase family protein [Ilumatobacteraceae bacterium]|nr:prephenate dehydrogenase/arogenate dehydrogenase family protein [Ilumatobacteraceae bacterium]